MTADDVIETACGSGAGVGQAAALVPYVRRSNVSVFLAFLSREVSAAAARGDAPEPLCEHWRRALLAAFECIDGRELMRAGETIRLLAAFQRDSRALRVFADFARTGELAAAKAALAEFPAISEAVWPSAPSGMRKDQFLQAVNADDAESVVAAFTEITVLGPMDAIEWLVAAIQAIDGLRYSRLGCVFQLLDERNLKYPMEMNILRILYLNSDHSVNFHELLKAPRDILFETITVDNFLALAPLGRLLGISSDELSLQFVLNVVTSQRFDDYAPVIAALKHKKSLEPLVAQIPQRLIARDRPRFFQSVGRLAEKRRYATINDLTAHGLTEFLDDGYLSHPSTLICELYSKMTLQESLGQRLHDLTRGIAEHFELAINKIREHLVELWLCEIEAKSVVDHPSIFNETLEEAIQKDENTNIQKSVFVLRAWKSRTAIKWLLRFIYQTGQVAYRAKSKAFACLFAVGDESEISGAFTHPFHELLQFHRQLYFGSRFAIVGVESELQDFSDENVPNTIANWLANPHIDTGICRVLLELMLSAGIDNRSGLLRVLRLLLVGRKRFLLQVICSVFTVFPHFRNDHEFIDLYRSILSAPIEELIAKSEFTTPFRAHHLSVLREVLDAVACESAPLDNWLFRGAEVPWESIVEQLCAAGFAAFGAELGAMAVRADTRRVILSNLLRDGHFDEALKFGYDREAVFTSIITDHLEQATQMLVDAHLEALTDWLTARRDEESMGAVTRTLCQQGRTVEAKRHSQKLAQY
jgi:hypothetical protein